MPVPVNPAPFVERSVESAMMEARAAGLSLESVIGEAEDDCPPRVDLPFGCLDRPEVVLDLPFLTGPVGGDQPAARGWLVLHKDRYGCLGCLTGNLALLCLTLEHEEMSFRFDIEGEALRMILRLREALLEAHVSALDEIRNARLYHGWWHNKLSKFRCDAATNGGDDGGPATRRGAAAADG